MSNLAVQHITRRLLAAAGEEAGSGALCRVWGAAPCHGDAFAHLCESHGPALWKTALGQRTHGCLASALGGRALGSQAASPEQFAQTGGLTEAAPTRTASAPALSRGASGFQAHTSAVRSWRGCSCSTGCACGTSRASGRSAGLRPLAARCLTAAAVRTFASSACAVSGSSSSLRGFCSDSSSSSSSGGGEGLPQERRLEPGATPLAAIQPRVVMVFTCTKCDTRSTKAFSKQSYQKGVVLVRCPGCQKLHLVADHLGWFGEEPFMLHEHVAQLGGNVVRISADDPRAGEAAATVSAAVAAAAPTAAAAAAAPGAGAYQGQQQQAAAGSDPADPGLAARTAAAVAAAVSSAGGLFELSDETQVRAALAEALQLKQQHAHRQQGHRGEPKREE